MEGGGKEGGMGWRVGCEGWEKIEQSPCLLYTVHTGLTTRVYLNHERAEGRLKAVLKMKL